MITHGDCIEEAQMLKKLIEETIPDKDVPIEIGYVGPIIGASAGPGTLGVCFIGKTVEFDSKK